MSTLSSYAAPRAAKPNSPAYLFRSGAIGTIIDGQDPAVSPPFGTAVSLLNGNLAENRR